MQVCFVFVQLEIENALLEVLEQQVVLLQEYFQRIFYFTCHLLSGTVHLHGKGCVHGLVVNLLRPALLFCWILLAILNLILNQLLNLILIIKVVHLLNY